MPRDSLDAVGAVKFTATPSELQRALAYVMPVISKQVSDPLFVNVLLEASDGTLRLRATDTIVSVSTRIDAVVEQPGKLGVSAERLHKIVSNFPDGAKVRATLKDAALHLKTKRSKSKLVTVDGDKFPKWPVPKTPGALLDPKVVLSCLRWVKHTLIDDPNRPALSGIRFIIQEEAYLTMSTCDSRRLSRTGALLENTGRSLEMFLPARPTRVLMKLCEWTKEGKISIAAAGRDAFFWNDEGLGYACKLISVKGLDPEAIKPKGNPKTLASFNRLSMIEALHRVRAIEEREVRFTVSKDAITLYVHNEKGEGEETVRAGVSGDAIEIKLSGAYVSEALASMKTENVHFYVWRRMDPVMFMPAGDEETFELLMSMV